MTVLTFLETQSRLFLCSTILLIYGLNAYSQCNGSTSLCNKKYNEVAYLTTHNAFNSVEDAFSYPNQNFNITSQLNDGVRALMIDVYDVSGTPTVYHGSSFLGSAPLLDFLTDIKTFLDNNSNEVVTIILECYTTADKIEGDINLAGLTNYLYTHLLGNNWPTLQTMINDGKRLVIFSDQNDANATQGWYHYVWDHAVETHFTAYSLSDFSCDFNRGNSTNDLFIFNHFITDSSIGVGIESEAIIANSNPFFIDRVLQCYQEKNKFPNFITIDFYDKGDGLDVVSQLNQLPVTNIVENESCQNLLIYPNPTNNIVKIENKIGLSNLKLITLLGKDITSQCRITKISDSVLTIDLSNLTTGIYFIKTNTTVNKLYKQ
jgi:hypothetical protein